MDVDLLIGRLGEIAGNEHVVTHPHQLRTYESDGLLQYRVSPRVAVLPASAKEVQAVVRWISAVRLAGVTG